MAAGTIWWMSAPKGCDRVVQINGTTITMTRGDTLRAVVAIQQQDGTDYTPVEGEEIRFAMKRKYTDSETLIYRLIPYDTMVLQLDPSDTKQFPFGNYVYDIQITKLDGTVDTFIDRAKLTLTEEVE